MAKQPQLRLLEFVPFRLNRLAAEVSAHLSEIYRERFGLEIPEWRILVTVASAGACTAQEVAQSTHMHKTRVSRAAARLEDMGLLERADSDADGRELELRLTAKGRRMYAELAPLVLAREQEMLACMNSVELNGFLKGLDKLEQALRLK